VPAFQLLHDIVRGEAPSLELAAGPAVGMGIKKLLTSDRVLDWLSKESEGKPSAPPVPERRSPSSKSGGPGGVERRSASDKVMQKEVLRESIANAEKQKAAKGDPGGIIARQIADFREMLAGL
jgi:hypothetical protein